MAHNNNLEVSYNVQTTVDAKHKLIADFKVTQKPNDLGQLAPMVIRAKRLFGNKTFEVLADKGYYQAKDLKKCERKRDHRLHYQTNLYQYYQRPGLLCWSI